ncbi:lipopolysaccharide assembly protein LapB [Endozoicomonas sp. OPT23]|uniref:lipopolysaccharide assembly protein LapB n=1 Tax=Endozoicomonas sp. OPT23 TaxID=2072845 RepID=UPI00129B4131|nr:lipopolysaccharide assembly protein LapB [Endozoicomonas sp. OPT23]MRI34481.1 lipopolysaccharide assembly protein LapB [Endozoicomonas sp. OPT23]
MPDIALLALILVAIFAGYLFGRAEKKKQLVQAQQNPLSKEYFVGLNYLLNEQTDEAIETFIKALDLNNDTVDTYLALGSLFCRRGEVEKSIRVHQDLLARPSLTPDQSVRVQLELAKDYMTAGLLDRAEAMLADLSRQNSPFRTEASEQLLKIYEQEREWQQAVEVTESLFRLKGEYYGPRLAHLYCELAEDCLNRNDRAGARRCLRTAFSRDRDCVRASLILGRIEFEEGRDREVIRTLQKVSRQNYRYIPLSLDLLEKASGRSNSERAHAGYLSRCLSEHPDTSVVLALTNILVKSRDEGFALEFLTEQLRRNPSLKGLNALIDLQLYKPADGSLTSLRLLQEVIDKMLEGKAAYQCHSCGFSGKEMHWHCPRCLDWGTITPVQGIEGS